jgi:hypothetical protein
MTAVLYDEVFPAAPAPKLKAAIAPAQSPGRPDRPFGGDPLVDGAARLLCVPLRQLYAALWRVGVLEVGA